MRTLNGGVIVWSLRSITKATLRPLLSQKGASFRFLPVLYLAPPRTQDWLTESLPGSDPTLTVFTSPSQAHILTSALPGDDIWEVRRAVEASQAIAIFGEATEKAVRRMVKVFDRSPAIYRVPAATACEFFSKLPLDDRIKPLLRSTEGQGYSPQVLYLAPKRPAVSSEEAQSKIAFGGVAVDVVHNPLYETRTYSSRQIEAELRRIVGDLKNGSPDRKKSAVIAIGSPSAARVIGRILRGVRGAGEWGEIEFIAATIGPSTTEAAYQQEVFDGIVESKTSSSKALMKACLDELSFHSQKRE